MSACGCFPSIEDVRGALETRADTVRLITWLDDDSKSCRCISRESICLLILNAIRDATRPFVESSPATIVNPTTTTTTPSKVVAICSDDFPPLQGMITPVKVSRASEPPMLGEEKRSSSSKVTQKKRIRPRIIPAAPVANASGPWKAGNLVGVASTNDMMPWRVETTPAKKTQQQSTTKSMVRKEATISEPSHQSTPAKPVVAVASFEEETLDRLQQQAPLLNLVELYVALIERCQVPSMIRELLLMVSAINASTSPHMPTAEAALSTILSSPSRCRFFGTMSLSRLSCLVKGIGPALMESLVKCSSFRAMLPELTAEFHVIMQQRASADRQQSSRPARHVALFTLPFDEKMDSRHNFKTSAEQAAYQNREETRDRFLHSLRSFYTSRGKGFDHVRGAQTDAEKVKREARDVIDQLLDANITWFCDFVSQMLLQLGLVPLEESDQELLNLTSQDKLSKLHQRFLDPQSNPNYAARPIPRAEHKRRSSSRNVSSPTMEAQQRFPGYQEYFYLFICQADSFRLGKTLLGTFTLRLNRITQELHGSMNEPKFTQRLYEAMMLARFIGLLCFSPNWGVETTETAHDGLLLLAATGTNLEEILQLAACKGSLVVTVPWLVQCLHLAKWDIVSLRSPRFLRTVSLLKQVQRHVWCQRLDTPCNNLFIVLCVESLLSELALSSDDVSVVGVDLRLPVQKDVDRSALDQIDHPSILSDNKDVVDLLAKVSKLDGAGFSPLRSPGASRKVRPSRVPAETVVSSNDVLVSSVDPVQDKLVETFFHLQPDVKEVWELLRKQLLANQARDVVDTCIRPRLATCHDNGPVVVEEIHLACREYVQQKMVQAAGTVLRVMLPMKDEQVISVAVSLLIHSTADALDAKLSSLVGFELNRHAKMHSKELFPSLSSKKDTDASAWEQALRSLENLSNYLINHVKEPHMAEMDSRIVSATHAFRELSTSRICIPSDERLRAFFQSVFTLDSQFSEKIMSWTLSDDFAVADRWKTISSFLELALLTRKHSQRGFWTLRKLLSSTERLRMIIQLGVGANVPLAQMSDLLSALSRNKIIQPLSAQLIIDELTDSVSDNAVLLDLTYTAVDK